MHNNNARGHSTIWAKQQNPHETWNKPLRTQHYISNQSNVQNTELILNRAPRQSDAETPHSLPFSDRRASKCDDGEINLEKRRLHRKRVELKRQNMIQYIERGGDHKNQEVKRRVPSIDTISIVATLWALCVEREEGASNRTRAKKEKGKLPRIHFYGEKDDQTY